MNLPFDYQQPKCMAGTGFNLRIQTGKTERYCCKRNKLQQKSFVDRSQFLTCKLIYVLEDFYFTGPTARFIKIARPIN